jgi:hypothetical protein
MDRGAAERYTPRGHGVASRWAMFALTCPYDKNGTNRAYHNWIGLPVSVRARAGPTRCRPRRARSPRSVRNGGAAGAMTGECGGVRV